VKSKLSKKNEKKEEDNNISEIEKLINDADSS
jgi:hypothetical protein